MVIITNFVIETTSANLCTLKKEFSKIYNGTSHIQEIIPIQPTGEFPVISRDLQLLHTFAQKNPIYYNSYPETNLSTPCMVYEGDINEHWLNSIKHSSSCQPFYPTWIFSAYLLVLSIKNKGYKGIVDIGSGDGRIAFCGKILGLESHSIEIDDGLIQLQNEIVSSTGMDFKPICADALDFDYGQFSIKHNAFFIGGLPQMGGDILANSIIEKVFSLDRTQTCFVFAGSYSKKHLSGIQKLGGWSKLVEKHNLRESGILSLPTVWTFDQDVDTPYIFALSKSENSKK